MIVPAKDEFGKEEGIWICVDYEPSIKGVYQTTNYIHGPNIHIMVSMCFSHCKGPGKVMCYVIAQTLNI